MAIRIQTRRTLGTEPPLGLAFGELAYAEGSDSLFVGRSDGSAHSLNQPELTGLADVATSGDYNDLDNLPTIPTLPTFATVALSGAYADLSGKPSLFSGSYLDLADKPTIPTLPTFATVALSGAYADLLGKPSLFSGSYNDLADKPTIPSGYTYDQPAEPLSSSSGQTWRKRSAGGLISGEFIYTNGIWRPILNYNLLPRAILPAISQTVISGSVTTSVQNVGIRRFTVGAAAAGTGIARWNLYSLAFQSLLGSNSSAFGVPVLYLDRWAEITFLVRQSAAQGILRLFLATNSTAIAAASELSVKGFGVKLTANSAVQAQVHDGTTLFTQAFASIPAVSGGGNNFEITFNWDGVSKFSCFVNGAFLGTLIQPLSGLINFQPVLTYEQSVSAAATQNLDIHYISAQGDFNA